MISRRHFLRVGARSIATGAGASVLHLSRMSAFAQPAPGYRALVCVFLHGGNDGNNTIVPMTTAAYQDYARGRSTLALPQASLLPITTFSGQPYGLHPELIGLQRLFQQRRLAIIANVGMLVAPLTRDQYQTRTAPLPRNLYSHIDQQMAWQTAIPAGGVATGWGGRAADYVGAAGAAAFPTVVSAAGNATFGTGVTSPQATIVPGMSAGLAGFDSTGASMARFQSFAQLLTLDSGTVLVGAASSTTREGLRQASLLNASLAARGSLSTPFPASTLGQQLSEVASVMNVRQELGASRQIFFCSLSGFDTHFAQPLAQAKVLRELGQALAAFHDATIEMGVDEQVTTFTLSEFGRTLQPASGYGTDHAWGNHHLVMGGAVRGGDIYGEFPTLALGGPDDVGNRGVWLPTLSLDQYGATLASWLGVAPGDLSGGLPEPRETSRTQMLDF